MSNTVSLSFSDHAAATASRADATLRDAGRPDASAAARTSIAASVQRMLDVIGQCPVDPAPGGERTLLASERSVDAGGVSGAYDLQLYREADGRHSLELDMKVEFDFTSGPDGQTWTATEKQQFMEDYNQVIQDAWSGKTLTGADGKDIVLNVNLDVVERPGGLFGGVRDWLDPSENWSIEVIKIDSGAFNQSYVVPSQNSGRFDSEDVRPVEKGASDPQIAAAHEFGHMIGLPDEYNGNGGADAKNDMDSIMHTGMDVRDRHFDHLESWLVEHQ